MEELINRIATHTSLPSWKVGNTIKLIDGGATIPFIARYRKESIGSIDEVVVSEINKAYQSLQELIRRRETILTSIGEQGHLTPELDKRIRNCWDSTTLEDLYLPYKPKRQTRATKAKDAGLEPLAQLIMEQMEHHPESRAKAYLCDAYPDISSVLQGAQDILAEWIAEDGAARNQIRTAFARGARIASKLIKGKEDEGQKYRDYFAFDEALHRCAGHRLLAIRRGESEGILRVSIQPEKEQSIERLERLFVKTRNGSGKLVEEAVADAYKRLLAPSIETEFRNSSKERADKEAIEVFAKNLRQLLLAPPLGAKRVMGIDPGFRSGCKVACLDAQGTFLHHDTIYPHPPQQQVSEAGRILLKLKTQYQPEAIAIGSGTAGRETEQWLRSVLGDGTAVHLISEDGASVYSASEIAREEFPELDLTVRGAISIGRRLLDPLAELVKIDPKSIGVGQYQHDVDQKLLRESLDEVVMSCVNSVGVNLNTASVKLLSYVSGIGKTGAENIVQYRTQNGPFTRRADLTKVKGIGPKAYEQSAGFLRIPQAENPLDNTAVHPERYRLVTQMAKDLRSTVPALVNNAELIGKIDLQNYVSEDAGIPTLQDILLELQKPGRDPRGEAVVFRFAEHIRTIDDLTTGMTLSGKVTNITKFGAFIDLGIKENGLVHVSQMANTFVSDPGSVVSLNQVVQVRIVEIDKERGRINLTMKGV